MRFLRRELGASSALQNRGADEIAIDGTTLWCDAAAFLDDMEAERYGEALELYRGDFLSGFFAGSGPACDHWLDDTRAAFRARAATAARRFADARERDESYTTAVASARRAVDLSGADERVFCELLRLLDRVPLRKEEMLAEHDVIERSDRRQLAAGRFAFRKERHVEAWLHRI